MKLYVRIFIIVERQNRDESEVPEKKYGELIVLERAYSKAFKWVENFMKVTNEKGKSRIYYITCWLPFRTGTHNCQTFSHSNLIYLIEFLWTIDFCKQRWERGNLLIIFHMACCFETENLLLKPYIWYGFLY
jgi:hypothetical protein